jgi:hypothetical protein
VNHAEVKSHLADYLEGELSLEKRALVDAHLDACGDCSSEVDEIQKTIQLLRMLPDPETPPMIAANVMRRIRAGENRPSFFERIGRTVGSVLESSFVLPASALAVASLVVAVVQNPEFFSSLSPSGEGEAFVTAQADSTAGVPVPFVGTIGNERSRAATSAARGDETFLPLQIQIGGTSVPRQQYSALGRGPRVPQVWVTNGVGSRPRSASGQGSGTFVSAEGMRGVEDVTRSASQTRRFGQGGSSDPSQGSGGGDPRDEWISHGLDHPIEFARYIGSQNLAEQELWVLRLSDRAESRGLMAELIRRLRESGDSTAAWLADDFASQTGTTAGVSSSAD